MVALDTTKGSAVNSANSSTNSQALRLADSSETTINVIGSFPLDTSPQSSAIAVADRNGAMLRDPRIDDYLAAHQRFSPSVYSSAQYVRSAAFVSDSGQ